MKLLTSLSNLLHPSRTSRELDEELRSHIQHRADDLERGGMSRSRAERQARIEFGGYTHYKQESREALCGSFVESLVQDIRFSLRMLRKSPAFTLAAILTLTLAIGANAVVFGIMDGLILRPISVPHYDTLYGTHYGDGSGFQSYLNYKDLRERNHSFEDIAAFNMVFVGLDTGNNPALATGYATSGNYFDVLQIPAYIGRVFHASEEHGPNSAPFVVLSYPYWHTHFQDNRGVLGQIVQVDNHPYTIIGVTPPSFVGTLLFGTADFYMPIVNEEQAGAEGALTDRSKSGIFEVFGHLKPGVTPAQATADVNAIGASLAKSYPKDVSHEDITLGREGLTSFSGPVKAFVAGLTLLAALVLLAACANLGSLFAARTSDRSREVALRLALGSSRTRILRQLLTEAVLISLVGGALGLFASYTLLVQLSQWHPFPGAPIHIPVTPDARLYIVSFALALISGFLFGIVPVRQVLRANPYEIVKAGSNARVGSKFAVRDVLLILQIAICALLVTSSLVAVRGLLRSLHADFGFDPDNAFIVDADVAKAGYTGEHMFPMQKRMIDAVSAVPGVDAVGLVNSYPPLIYGAATRANIFKDETKDLRPSNIALRPFQYDISPGYFAAANTTLLAGRSLTWHDDKDAPPVAIVNREFATQIFGSVTNALGKFIRLQDDTRCQIVGVAENGKYLSISDNKEPAMFVAAARHPVSAATLVVRSRRDPQQITAAIRNKLHELDPGLPMTIDPWTTMLNVVLFPSRVATVALGVLGILGAMLSITGIFGMAAYSVSKRLRELGIRIALGAQRTEVLQTALGRPLRLLALGSTAGLLLGLLATKVLAVIVYEATPRDPFVLAGVIVAMCMLGLVATWIPAQRALSVNPLILLREE